jgi:acetate kinase
MAAVRGGRSIDTTMGLTPGGGLVQSSRTGDLDPGVVVHLARTEGLDVEGFHEMTTHAAGLLGVSETSSDVRDLLAREGEDERAAQALGLFCHAARKHLGALAAVLGGLDALVFSGGIGENSAAIRARICDGLGFLGIDLDPERNAAGEGPISRPGARAQVWVIPTDEEVEIAAAALRVIADPRA